MKNIEENIIRILNEMKKKESIINLLGFINTQFIINNLNYELKNDILTIRDNNENIFSSINLNQVYKHNRISNGIELYLDNDLIIRILKK